MNQDLLFFYGTECPHCIRMDKLLDKLKKEEGIKVEKERLLNLSLAYESHPDNITPAVMGGFNVASVHENEVKFINKSIKLCHGFF